MVNVLDAVDEPKKTVVDGERVKTNECVRAFEACSIQLLALDNEGRDRVFHALGIVFNLEHKQ